MTEENGTYSRQEARDQILQETRKARETYGSPAYLLREKELRRDRRRDLLSGLALFLAVFSGVMFYAHNYVYNTYSVDAEMKPGIVSYTELQSFADGALLLGKDSVTYVADGTVRWTSVISMKDPMVRVRGEYFCLADGDGGYQVLIGSTEGLLSTVRLSRKVQDMDISLAGVTAVFTESSDAAYVSYFDRYGTRISVEVKMVLNSSGYPLDIAVSPDGQKLLILAYSTVNGIGESRLLLYDFKNGRAENSYEAASLTDYFETDTLLIRGLFLDDSHIAAVGDNRTTFFTYVPKKELENVVELSYGDTLCSVVAAGENLCLISEEESGRVCRIYDMKGTETVSFPVPDRYDDIRTSGSQLVFLSGRELNYYNLSGRHRYCGSLPMEPVSLCFSGSRSLLWNTGSVIEMITLK